MSAEQAHTTDAEPMTPEGRDMWRRAGVTAEYDALADLTEAEAEAVDRFMNEHMHHHRHIGPVYAMGCDAYCRTRALAEAFRQHVLVPRRKVRDTALSPEAVDRG